MATFPHQKASPVHVYYVHAPHGSALPSITIAQLRDALKARMLTTRAPTDLTRPNGTDAGSAWGWYFDDGVNPLHSGNMLSWGVRRWVKKADASLLKARVADRRAELERELQQQAQAMLELGTSPPWKELRAEMQAKLEVFEEAQHDELKRLAVPSVVEHAILLDDNPHEKRLAIFAASAAVRDLMLTMLRPVLSKLYFEPRLSLRPYTIYGHLADSRPDAHLPEGVGARFLTHLVQHATQADERGDLRDVLALPMSDHTTHVVIVGLGDRIDIKYDDDKVAIVGHDQIDDYMADEQMADGYLDIQRVELIFGQRANRNRFAVLVTDEGVLARVRLLDKTDASGKTADERMHLRSLLFYQAHDCLRALVQAYDHGELYDLLAKTPQRGLFPLEARGCGQWLTPSEAGIFLVPSEEEDPPMIAAIANAYDVERGS